MALKLRNQQAVIFNAVHHSMLVRDAARPESRERVLQGPWLPNTRERLSLHFTKVRSVPLPSASCVAAAKSRLALVGLRSKYAVSSSAL